MQNSIVEEKTSKKSITEYEDLIETVREQKTAFIQDKFPSFKIRSARLARLREMIKNNQADIIQALKADFGNRARHETQLVEIISSLNCIDYMASHLGSMMNRKSRSTSIWFLPGTNRIIPQPLGVIGIMSPWNYPINLAVGPLAAALAAGNRAVIRMSEYTPATTALFKKLIEAAFDKNEVAVFGGDAEFAAHFSQQKFDHILFTGSTQVGRKVMAAAAQNLIPVTLELGGKSPVIVAQDYNVKEAGERVAWGKIFNAGQTCVAPDYVFVPRNKVDNFVQSVKRCFEERVSSENLDDYTSIINDRFYSRLLHLVDDAKRRGAEIIQAELPKELRSNDNRILPLTIAITDDPDAIISKEEIFGPLLLVRPYDDISEVIDLINANANPLALYLFTHSSEIKDRILHETSSGGVCINDVMLQFLQVDLPFGGVGGSGFGKYHGREGFETFSNMKPVFQQRGVGTFTGLKMLYPPYGKVTDFMIKLMGR